MELFNKIFLIVIFAAGASHMSGCKTERGDRQSLTGEDIRTPGGMDREDLHNVPISMWSPLQRQSTASYYFLAGEMMTMRGEKKLARDVFEAAYNMDPTPFVGAKLISAKAVTGELQEAVADAHRMTLLYPKDAQLRLLYGQLLNGQQKFEDAAEQLQRAVDLDPSIEAAYLQLIGALQSSKATGKAIKVAQALVKRDPESIAGWSALSRLFIVSGKKKEALAPAQRAFELQSANPELALILAIAYELNDRSKDAMALYEQLYRLNPSNEELTSRMVEIYRQLGNLEDALQILDDTDRAAKGTKPAIRMQKAILLWELKRDKEAADLLEAMAKEFPDSDRLLYMAGVGQEKLQHSDEALARYLAIPKESGLRAHGEIRAALIYKDQKRFSEAEAIARKLQSGDQASSSKGASKPETDSSSGSEPAETRELKFDATLLLGAILADSDRADEAVAVMKKAYEEMPDRPRLLFMQGVYFERAGKPKDAMAIMRKVIQVDSKNSSAFNYLGYMLAERGESLEEAEKLVRRALELKPNDGYYLDSLGWILFQRGNQQEALKVLHAAAKLTPDEGVIFEHLAEVYIKLGKFADARQSFEKALQTKLEKRDQERIENKFTDFKKRNPDAGNGSTTGS